MARTTALIVAVLLVAGASGHSAGAEPPVASPMAASRRLPVEIALPAGPANETTIAGTARDIASVEWGIARFAEAGLELPAVAVSIHEDRVPCNGNVGYAVVGDAVAKVDICDDRDLVRVLMHELAHVWVDAAVDEATRAAFTEFRGAPTWNDSDNWYDHASEQAAETVAWVLLEGAMHLKPRMTMKDPGSLRTGFTLLTGVTVPDWDADPVTAWAAGRQDGLA